MSSGGRCARCAAAWMRRRTASMSAARLLDRVKYRFGRRGVLARRRELQVLLERRLRVRQLAFVYERHAEPVVRVGHLGIELGGLLEHGLRFGHFALIPEDDALVEDLARVAAVAHELERFRAHLGGLVELLLL